MIFQLKTVPRFKNEDFKQIGLIEGMSTFIVYALNSDDIKPGYKMRNVDKVVPAFPNCNLDKGDKQIFRLEKEDRKDISTDEIAIDEYVAMGVTGNSEEVWDFLEDEMKFTSNDIHYIMLASAANKNNANILFKNKATGKTSFVSIHIHDGCMADLII